MTLALTRAVPSGITRCELTHIAREPIDFARATEQHARYEAALASRGCTIHRLPRADDLPDSAFVEDLAVVLPELAIIARPGAESRRAEVPPIIEALGEHRHLAFIESPGTLDGGDVLRIGSDIFVGQSGRTNVEALSQLRTLAEPLGYRLHAVNFTGCLHLKTAVTQVAPGAVLLNPAWVDPAIFDAFERITVDEREPFAANVLLIGDVCLPPSHYPETRRRLENSGVAVDSLDCDELAKAEAGLTCCSVLLDVE